ncbi:uncharacterized protein LOC118412135 [Branchiostoma floridae]|uniref:Uncharacterized protein LOC118412135 n=1 Tax=Branchiostoma floridae TaxID=7739 RepID=A0A9J7MK84_BRAFL|nr:uncharacterized protein LOC118412135 [Branchiostoma floridae]
MQQPTDTAVSKGTSSGGCTAELRPESTVSVVSLGGGDADSSTRKDVQFLQLYNNLWYGQMCALPRLQGRSTGYHRASSASTPGPRPILCHLPIASPLGKSVISPSGSIPQCRHASSITRNIQSSNSRLFSPLFTSTPTNQSPGQPDFSPPRYVLDTTTSSSKPPSVERHFVFSTSTHVAVPLYSPHSGLTTAPKGRHPIVLANCLSSPPSYVGKALTHAAERVFTTMASHTLPKPPSCSALIGSMTASSNNSSENKGKTQDSNLQNKEVMVPPPRRPVGPRRCLAKEFGHEHPRKHHQVTKDDIECSVLPATPCTSSNPCQHGSCESPFGERVPMVTTVRPSQVRLPVPKPNKSAPAIPAYLTKTSPEDTPYFMPSPVYLLSGKQCSTGKHPRVLQSPGITKSTVDMKPSVRMRPTLPKQGSTSYTVQLIPRSNQAPTYLSKVPGTVMVENTALSNPKILSGKTGLFPQGANKATVLLSSTGLKQRPCAGESRSRHNTPNSQSATDKICNPAAVQSSDFDPSVFLVALPGTGVGVCKKEKSESYITDEPLSKKNSERWLHRKTTESGSDLQSDATKDHCADVPLDILCEHFDNMSSYGRKCRGATQVYGFSFAPIPQPEGYHVICPHCGRELSRERPQASPATDPVSWYDRNCYICQQNPYKARCYT